ncbi:MAG: hypothetical protein ACPGTS_02410 [Minisyncoccia bacterium]
MKKMNCVSYLWAKYFRQEVYYVNNENTYMLHIYRNNIHIRDEQYDMLGRIREIEFYNNFGQKTKHKFFDKNENLYELKILKNGFPVHHKVWNKNGELVTNWKNTREHLSVL